MNKKKVIINADDYGLTDHISLEILQLLKEKKLNSTSVLVNGYCGDSQLIKLSDFKKDINIKLHLNLIESNSLLFEKNKNINLLVNKFGYMNNNFIDLLLKKIFYKKKKFIKLKSEIKKEISLQIEKFKDFFALDYLSIDSHQHVHNIPFVFQIINNLRSKYKIKHLRLTNEAIHLSDLFNLDFSTVNNKSIVKKFFFNFLNRINHNSKQLYQKNYSIGLCEKFNHNNTLLYSRLNNFLAKDFNFLEIFCHPGKALKKEFLEKQIKRKKLIDFYTSDDRDHEKEFLISSQFSYFLLNVSSLNRKNLK